MMRAFYGIALGCVLLLTGSIVYTASVDAAERLTVNTTFFVPVCPSGVLTSLMVRAGGVDAVIVVLVASLVEPSFANSRA